MGLQTAPNHIPCQSTYHWISSSTFAFSGLLEAWSWSFATETWCFLLMPSKLWGLSFMKFRIQEDQWNPWAAAMEVCTATSTCQVLVKSALAHEFQSLADTWVAACYLIFFILYKLYARQCKVGVFWWDLVSTLSMILWWKFPGSWQLCLHVPRLS